MVGERAAQKDVEESHQEGWRDKEPEPRPRVGWGGVGRRGSKPWKLGGFPVLGASPGPGFSDFPNAREIQGSLCGLRLFAPDPDLVMPLIWFLNSGFAAFWAGAVVC